MELANVGASDGDLPGSAQVRGEQRVELDAALILELMVSLEQRSLRYLYVLIRSHIASGGHRSARPRFDRAIRKLGTLAALAVVARQVFVLLQSRDRVLDDGRRPSHVRPGQQTNLDRAGLL